MERSCFDLGDKIAVAEADLDFPCLPRTASFGAVALLAAALLTLGARDAGAQAYGQGDCLPPPNSFYGGGGWPDVACGSLDPGISTVTSTDLFLVYTNCSAPPPSLPGSAVDIPLDGHVASSGYVVTCGDPDCYPHYCEVPSGSSVLVHPTLHVSFNHEAGSTRFFDITMSGFEGSFGCGSPTLSGGNGVMTIEDLGGGTFLFNSFVDFVLTEPACGNSFNERWTLSSSPVSDVPPGRAAISQTLSLAVPSPVRSRAPIDFTLPSEGPVNLAVYDVSGRRVASLLDAEAMPAGPHQVALSTRDLPSGCYFCRLLTHDGSRTQRMLVLR